MRSIITPCTTPNTQPNPQPGNRGQLSPCHPCARTSARGTHTPSPTRLPHPFERDNFFVADSDTNMRQMRQISALQNPSPATALSPFAAIFRRSPDTNLPRVRQRFPSWPRYNHETMRQLSATKNSPQLRFLSRQLRTLHSLPVFTATKSPGIRQAFRSWLRYNHETSETATLSPSLTTHPSRSSFASTLAQSVLLPREVMR